MIYFKVEIELVFVKIKRRRDVNYLIKTIGEKMNEWQKIVPIISS